VLFAVSLSACDKPAQQTEASRPSPQESFEFIASTIRRGIEPTSGGMLSGGLSTTAGGYTALSIKNKVVDEYIAPSTDADPPRGRITIESESEVTIQPGARNDGARDGEGATERGTPGEGTSDIESKMSSARDPSRGKEGPSLSDAPLPRSNKSSATYELIHQNGRWELVTKIDQEKDQAAFEAFQYALKTQL
jgi:hypothetical protein